MLKIFFALCIITGSIQPVNAQEKLSLSDAIRIGLEKNFSIRIEKRQAEIARNNNNAGEAGRWPLINMGIGQNVSLTELDNPAGFLRAGNIKGSTFNPLVNLNWNLFNGFNVQITSEKLDFLEKQSLGNVQLVVENAIQSIILAYFTTVLEKERLEVFKRTLKKSSDRYEYQLLRSSLGTSVTFDVLQDKNAFLTDSSNYIQQVLNYRNATRNLNLLMGEDVNKVYQLTDSLNINPRDFILDELYGLMTANNTNLQNQFINQEILRKDVGLAKSSLYPRIEFNLSGNQSRQWQDLSSAEFQGGFRIDEPITSSTLNYTAGLTLNYTLFNGGRIRRQLENARIIEQIGLLQVDELKASLKNNLISTYDEYNLRKTLLFIAAENIEASELNLQLATERYENGTINSFNFRDIQINHLTTSLSYLQAVYNLIDTETELMRLTGGISGQ